MRKLKIFSDFKYIVMAHVSIILLLIVSFVITNVHCNVVMDIFNSREFLSYSMLHWTPRPQSVPSTNLLELPPSSISRDNLSKFVLKSRHSYMLFFDYDEEDIIELESIDNDIIQTSNLPDRIRWLVLVPRVYQDLHELSGYQDINMIINRYRAVVVKCVNPQEYPFKFQAFLDEEGLLLEMCMESGLEETYFASPYVDYTLFVMEQKHIAGGYIDIIYEAPVPFRFINGLTPAFGTTKIIESGPDESSLVDTETKLIKVKTGWSYKVRAENLQLYPQVLDIDSRGKTQLPHSNFDSRASSYSDFNNIPSGSSPAGPSVAGRPLGMMSRNSLSLLSISSSMNNLHSIQFDDSDWQIVGVPITQMFHFKQLSMHMYPLEEIRQQVQFITLSCADDSAANARAYKLNPHAPSVISTFKMNICAEDGNGTVGVHHNGKQLKDNVYVVLLFKQVFYETNMIIQIQL